jgi:hypothetical protein
LGWDWQNGEIAKMTIKLTGRLASALAIGLVAVFAAVSPVAADESTAVSSPSDTSRGLSLGQAQAAANDQASSDEATSQEAQPAADPQAAQPSAAVTQQAESPSPATSAQVAANDDNAGWDTTALIGKVLIGVGTLLTLGSAARMLMS